MRAAKTRKCQRCSKKRRSWLLGTRRGERSDESAPLRGERRRAGCNENKEKKKRRRTVDERETVQGFPYPRCPHQFETRRSYKRWLRLLKVQRKARHVNVGRVRKISGQQGPLKMLTICPIAALIVREPNSINIIIKEGWRVNFEEILKSGPLLISSKGIGWTSWKKRWFVLSHTSLMFYRADPNVLPPKGSETPNPTLGGIELNNSGSVVVKTDKKLLTVLFPDGRDGRAFTLKTDTLEELNEWKIALENALAQAPSAAQVMGQNAIFRNEAVDLVEASIEQCKDKPPSAFSIIGRPVLLALEDSDGSPSFLEKALRFIEEHGKLFSNFLIFDFM
ncbi:hypothetical protein HPP92_024810 [Vanilla planifolia]|uniref:PH domain-containing protein n=1 Tax=Vanilla planifolia TaxID=51239 RepID=A0A835PMN4_VANPL|nr:hypothetical protein HPP92_024810 [Vanilla planifolia]